MEEEGEGEAIIRPSHLSQRKFSELRPAAATGSSSRAAPSRADDEHRTTSRAGRVRSAPPWLDAEARPSATADLLTVIRVTTNNRAAWAQKGSLMFS
eukprot:9475741-Pyramimonas_sp.AAC.2